MGVISCRSRRNPHRSQTIYELRYDAMFQQQSGTGKRGRQQGEPLFGKASLLYGEIVIEYHPVSDIAALQQHDTEKTIACN